MTSATLAQSAGVGVITMSGHLIPHPTLLCSAMGRPVVICN